MSDREITDATWLTLPELESIDLETLMGLPDDIGTVLRRPGRYFNFSRIVDGEEERIYPGQLGEQTIRTAFEQEG